MPLVFPHALTVPPPLPSNVLGTAVPAMTTFLCFCVHSEDLFDLVRSYVGKDVPYATFSIVGPTPVACSHLVFLDATAEAIAGRLKRSKELNWEKRVIAVNRKTHLDLAKIQSSSEVFKSSVAIFRHDNTTLALASPFDEPPAELYPFKATRRLRPYDALEDFTLGDDLKGYAVLSSWRLWDFVECHVDIQNRVDHNLERKLNDVTVKYIGGTAKLYEELSRYLGFNDQPVNAHSPMDRAVLYFCEKYGYPNSFLTCKTVRNEDEYSNHADVDVGFFWPDIDDIKRLSLLTRDVGPVYSEVRATVLVRRPTSSPPGALAPVHTFTSGTWCLLGFSFVAVFASYLLLNGRRDSASDLFFKLLGILALAGALPRRSASAVVLVAWSLFAVFNAAAITSELLDRATLPVFTPRVDMMDEATYDGYNFGSFEDITYRYVKSNDSSSGNRKLFLDAIRQVMAEELKNNEYFLFPSIIVDRNLVMPVVALQNGEELFAKFRTMKRLENKFIHNYEKRSIGVKRQSPIYPAVNRGVQRLLEIGIYDYHKKRAVGERHVHQGFSSSYERRLTVEEDHPEYEATQLTVETLKLPLVTLAVGLCLGFCFLLAEIVNDKDRNLCELLASACTRMGICWRMAQRGFREEGGRRAFNNKPEGSRRHKLAWN